MQYAKQLLHLRQLGRFAAQRDEIATDHYSGGVRIPDHAGLHPGLYHKGLLDAARDVLRQPDRFFVGDLLALDHDPDLASRLQRERFRHALEGVGDSLELLEALDVVFYVLASGAGAGRAMRKAGGGAIINISSISRAGNAGQSNYSAAKAGVAGHYPFTRGISSSGYRARPWTFRMFSGHGSPKETNERFKYLLSHGETGLSTAFDLPTLMGIDSDDPRAQGEVGKEGVAIDSLKDFEILFDGIDLSRVSTSMTILPDGPRAMRSM